MYLLYSVLCSGRPKSDSPTIEMGTYGGVGSTLGGIGGGLSKASSVPLGNSTLLSLSPSGSKSYLLRRMPRVASDEAQTTHHSSSEDCRLTQPLLQKPESPVSLFNTPNYSQFRIIKIVLAKFYLKTGGSDRCRSASVPAIETPPSAGT